jgi:hypothetical protein
MGAFGCPNDGDISAALTLDNFPSWNQENAIIGKFNSFFDNHWKSTENFLDVSFRNITGSYSLSNLASSGAFFASRSIVSAVILANRAFKRTCVKYNASAGDGSISTSALR